MSGKAIWILIVFPFLFSFQAKKPAEIPKALVKEYQKAAWLYNDPKANDSSYTAALKIFQSVLYKLEQNPPFPGSDTLLYQCWLKKGILHEILNKNYREAAYAYRKAIETCKKNPGADPELLFSALTYAGSCYYNLNHFDSANFYLGEAQELIKQIPELPDKEFVFNTLGVLYYDAGNYQQSRNYFGEALRIIQGRKHLDIPSAVSIETNIATALYRMDQYDEAIQIYKKILLFNKFTHFINMNLGRALAALGKYEEAIRCFKKVDPKELPAVYNEIAYAQMRLGQFDAALGSLDQMQKAASATRINQLDMGINFLYRADLQIKEGQCKAALPNLQKAIGIFSGHFKDTSLQANPRGFTGTLTYYWLYEALFQKASCFESLFKEKKNPAELKWALDVYETILSLLSYVEKSYATDDAKTFLKKKSWESYQKAFEVCLALDRLAPKQNWLEKAFQISERNKASIVAASLNERKMNGSGVAETKLFEEERNIKYNIARLNVKSNQSQDAQTLEGIASEKSALETRLEELQKTIEKNNHYYKIKYDDSYPSIRDLQQVLRKDEALISFYTASKTLHAFLMTREGFSHVQFDSFPAIEDQVATWLRKLKSIEPGRKFDAGAIGESLSKELIKPIASRLADKKEWIIIPDGILSYLPFESLPSPDGKSWLLETTAISYQFSTKFLIRGLDQETMSTRRGTILALAPFAGKAATTHDTDGFLQPLPASGLEIESLNGKKLLGSEATKTAFLQEMSHYPVIHLATHARSDVENSSASFVAFYPKKGSAIEDNLYLEELYGMNLEGNQLMIISACETGQGELVANEGVISIARAFTYAGCSSVVNSLWKADDEATASILKQFHFYLQKGLSKSRALQKAKIDFINGNSLHRSPEYWSHLILIGNPDPIYSGKKTWLIAMAGSCMLFAGLLLMSLKKEKKSTLS